MSHKDEIDITRKTHSILNGLTGANMELVASDPPARTDCETKIWAPLEDPDILLLVMHEWSHRLFKTRLKALNVFMAEYKSEYQRKHGASLSESGELLLAAIAYALDDLRVLSLSYRVYPGSAVALKERWLRLLDVHHTQANIITFVLSVGLGKKLAAPAWNKYLPEIDDVVRATEGSGYSRVLRGTKFLGDLLLQDKTFQENNPLTKVKLHRMREAAGNVTGSAEEPNRPATNQEMWLGTAAANESLTEEYDRQELEKLEDAILELVQTASKRPYDELHRDPLKVSITEVPRTLILEQPFTPDQVAGVQRLKSVFSKITASKKRALDDSGTDLDVEKYLDMRRSGDTAVFRNDSTDRGFAALFLLDMSGSMKGRWGTLSSACKMFVASVKSPNTTFEAWGFSGDQNGNVRMLRFMDPSAGFESKEELPDVWGLTPLHTATPVAVRRLRSLPGTSQHLFIITDGMPQDPWRPQELLTHQVAHAVSEAKALGIHVNVLIVGTGVPSQALDLMFHRVNLSTVYREEDLTKAVLTLSQKAYESYLKRGA